MQTYKELTSTPEMEKLFSRLLKKQAKVIKVCGHVCSFMPIIISSGQQLSYEP